MEHADLVRAIEDRHAVRKYHDQSIPESVRMQLNAEIERHNRESGLAIRASYDDPDAFGRWMSHYGRFSGVRNYLAMVGRVGTDLDLACGYHGQQLVLLAQHLGLNTCWVGVSYDKSKVEAKLGEEETLALVIALGYGETGGRPHPNQPIEKLGGVRGGGELPDWFRRGLELAALAPSALNKQGFYLELDKTTVHADLGSGSFAAVNFGIAKFHFEVGAGDADWSWG